MINDRQNLDLTHISRSGGAVKWLKSYAPGSLSRGPSQPWKRGFGYRGARAGGPTGARLSLGRFNRPSLSAMFFKDAGVRNNLRNQHEPNLLSAPLTFSRRNGLC
jgi:hypothetical protein